MAGNTFGRLFTVTSFGESHGPALGCVVDGCPPGLEICEAELQVDVDRRRPGNLEIYQPAPRARYGAHPCRAYSRARPQARRSALLVANEDQRSRDYEKIKDRFRPGHADYTYQQKYGFRDYRGGGRSSARETVVRVAAGAIARKFLRERQRISIHGYLAQLGPLVLQPVNPLAAYENPFFCPDPGRVQELEDFIWRIREAGDSIGARVTVIAKGVPPGWGEPVFERLDADLASAMMGINAVKGVEIGAGFRSVEQRGSEHRDEMTPQGFKSNHAGGVLGGISSGQDIVVSLALKPTSSIVLPGQTINVHGEPVEVVTTGRHDPCVGIRATPIAEAMLALVLMDHYLRFRAQCADVVSPTPVITR